MCLFVSSPPRRVFRCAVRGSSIGFLTSSTERLIVNYVTYDLGEVGLQGRHYLVVVVPVEKNTAVRCGYRPVLCISGMITAGARYRPSSWYYVREGDFGLWPTAYPTTAFRDR